VELEVQTQEKRAILVVRGKLTSDDTDLLGQKIDDLFRAGYREFILDLEGVPYLDSAGLGTIVRLYTAVGRRGGTLKLLNLNERIMELLSITKLLPPWF
jgi:anti-sigma B factor antagonist